MTSNFSATTGLLDKPQDRRDALARTVAAHRCGGGGAWGGAHVPLLAQALAQLADAAGQRRYDLEQVADQPVGSEPEDRRVRIAVDRDDDVGVLHPHLVLDLAGDAAGDVQAGPHRLSRLAHL